MNDVTFVVEIFFSFDRPPGDVQLNPKWIKRRFEIFKKYTMPNLLNQSFQDFRLFIICGNKHMNITENLPWHSKAEIYHVEGENRLEFPKRMRPASRVMGYDSIDTEYVAITRIDSDDLFNLNLIEEIKDSIFLDNKRSVLMIRQYIVWDVVRHYILYKRRGPTSPFYTHVFPRSIHKNWNDFVKQHYLNHRFAGPNLPMTKEIKGYKVCHVRHDNNISDIKKGGKIVNWHGERIIDKKIVNKVLREFGIEEAYKL